MLKNRYAQAGVMVGVMGLMFGMALAPIPNVTSEYVLGDILSNMEFHYDRHQAAVEAYKLINDRDGPNFLLDAENINSVVDSSDCENSDEDYFQFGYSNPIFGSTACQEGPDTEYSTGMYVGGGSVYQPSQTNSPPRISFFVREERQSSVYVELSDITLDDQAYND